MKHDLPFYNGDPVSISPVRWGILMLGVVAGLSALLFMPTASLGQQLASRLLFMAIPLGCLAWLSGGQHGALFGPFGWREARISVLAAVLAILTSLGTALIVAGVTTVAANPLVTAMEDERAAHFAISLLSTLPQLLGEELLTVLPFLALLRVCTAFGMARTGGIAIALVGSTLIFSAAHLPTYDWNWVQCLAVIGSARVVLTLAYVLSRNLWVSTGAHVLTDWMEFSLVFLAHSRA